MTATDKIHNISIDYTRDQLFDALGLRRLRDSYMRPDEQSPQERFAFVSNAFGSNPEHAQRLYDYASKHWLSYSTPILSFGRNARGQPISCFLPYLHDSASGLVECFSEVSWLSMMGGGVGLQIGIRATDEKSVGVMPHLKVYDAGCLAYKQGTTRRGSYAAFLDISHPDIVQFIEMRKATGDQNIRTLNLNHGINISDKFMHLIEECMLNPDADDSWELIQPHSGQVVEVVSAKELWMKILTLRLQTGEPYLWFSDTANRALPAFQRELGLQIHGSNLCTEIALPTNAERTAVCCLSSVNIEHYDDWKDHPTFIEDVLEMLDNVITYFVANAPDEIARARYSAERERSVGVGALGFHAYLQKHDIPFESALAKSFNNRLFKTIRKRLDQANIRLAYERGACPDAAERGVMVRCAHVAAIAPNASSSIIMQNTSPSIEPYAANAYRQDTTSGAFLMKNRFLDIIIKQEAADKSVGWYDDVWASITANDGSVQHLDWLSDHRKLVYKTAIEIDQRWIIEHAADRQLEIDQAQSVNTFFSPNVSIKYLHAVHFLAWKRGLKSMYYCRSSKLRKADKVGQSIERKRIEEEIDMEAVAQGTECLACE